MQITLALARPTAPAIPTPRVLRVAAMFGLGADESRTLSVIPPIVLDLQPHQLVFITGPSGGGKSTLMRLIAEALDGRTGIHVLRLDDLPTLPDRPLVDCLAVREQAGDRLEGLGSDDDAAPALARALEFLSLAGLSDAFVMLRRPAELSDGQRARLRLAQMLDLVARPAERAAELTVILADEFGATLDRITAHSIARTLRHWTRRHPVCLIAATTHDDLLEPLDPDLLIEKGLGDAIEVATRRI
jgi:ABC-type ATPase with predicted acetyltransferase domain